MQIANHRFVILQEPAWSLGFVHHGLASTDLPHGLETLMNSKALYNGQTMDGTLAKSKSTAIIGYEIARPESHWFSLIQGSSKNARCKKPAELLDMHATLLEWCGLPRTTKSSKEFRWCSNCKTVLRNEIDQRSHPIITTTIASIQKTGDTFAIPTVVKICTIWKTIPRNGPT